jgi:prepilin-type N-terminal cleavage/methylation domain-containing protein
MKYNLRGFTLIELSIVLVIIGLIIGGILVGQDLIRVAAVRATIAQIEKYNTAANTFLVKYGYLPGDIPAAGATQFGFAARGQYAGEGDGNRILEGVDSDAAGRNSGCKGGAGEVLMFWVDLSAAHMIYGGFTAGSPNVVIANNVTITTTSSPAISAYLPMAKLSDTIYINVWSGGFTPVTSPDGLNYFGLSGVNALDENGDEISGALAGLSVNQAYAIDSKIDDGMPVTGSVLSLFCEAGTATTGDMTTGVGASVYTVNPGRWAQSSTSCFDNGNVNNAPLQYSLTNGNALNCGGVSVRFK